MAIRFIDTIPATKAAGKVADVYAEMKRDFMLAEPISLHAPAPELMSACWSVFRDIMIGEGETERWDREVVAGAVSAANDCIFCSTTHTAMEQVSPAPSWPRDREALARWARRSLAQDVGPAPGMTAVQTDELRSVVVLFVYLNRMVSTFMHETSPFDAPADGHVASEAEANFRARLMAMVRQQMAKTVARSTATAAPTNVVPRLPAGLPAQTPAVEGAAAAFVDLVARRPSESRGGQGSAGRRQSAPRGRCVRGAFGRRHRGTELREVIRAGPFHRLLLRL